MLQCEERKHLETGQGLYKNDCGGVGRSVVIFSFHF